METVIFIAVCVLVAYLLLRPTIKRLKNASKHGKCECGGTCSCGCGKNKTR